MDFEKGEVLLINKPIRWTSFDVVAKLKGALRVRKIGHAGTLDPLATGLLILCTGKMTKQIDLYQGQEKEYTGTFRLGVTTASYDLEQPIDAHFPTEHITEELIYENVKRFKGIVVQYPPPHSAVKVDGKRAYKIARAGKQVHVKAREVEIKEFEITAIDFPVVFFRIVCSKGTYIRSIAHDFGKSLGSGACLESLVRTRIGKFQLKDAMELSEFIEKNRNSDPASNS
ncbi:MAG TPA: tRNA pseudouridine(55) synthase TruB [Bacteroidia bacterium]|nr:tRNA pseudouridine(55) synthase TruB [Bacteroidia bacterium]